MFQGRFSVIIVGAGMAGLGAAMKLIEARIYDVLILEGNVILYLNLIPSC